MNTVSITQLKTNPSKAIRDASDFPILVESRNKAKAYLIGKDLYNSIISYIEDFIDKNAIRDTDFTKGKSLSKVAKDLGI